MSTETIVWIIFAGIAAILISLFQYYYKAKRKDKTTLLFAFLRCLTWFAVFLLLINPSLKKKTYYQEKPKLVLAVDNSASIKHLDQTQNVNQLLAQIKASKTLQDRFDFEFYSFSEQLRDTLDLSFKGPQTNISKSLEELDQVYKNKIAPVVLISDGNQTYGKDYQYLGTGFKQQIYPIAIGDTIKFTDAKINKLNVNRYAFVKNRFPVEVIVSYSGSDQITTNLSVTNNGATVYATNVDFSKNNNSAVLNFELPAEVPGVQVYKVNLDPIPGEKNKVNNVTTFAVEVIDQKTNVLVISDITHPDLGTIKKSIESNEQRSVTLKKPIEVKDLEDYQLVILYQPNSRFQAIFEKLSSLRKNYFIVAASNTDWVFLNRIQDKYRQEITRQTEYYLPRFNSNYGSFLAEDIGFSDYPPLIGNFGESSFNGAAEILLYRNINDIETQDPLLITAEEDGIRTGMLFGEGIWRWRANSYLINKEFESFDNFFGKIIQYLASNKKRSRLNTIAESFYYGNAGVTIKAEYFTKNYEFDSRGNLQIDVRNKATDKVQTIPMLLKNNSYEVVFSNLVPGEYDYTVRVMGENLSRSGSFSVLEYDVEQQFVGTDVTKLSQLATNSNGKLYYANQFTDLVNSLTTNPNYKILQKSNTTVVSFIDWKYLLAFIIFCLAAEWFLRKYYGHI
ncbi:VWA domain-containing protein [Aquimarina brevivitae]|uniref:VWA domain-containing protein n=1 Tax=Aquimarina brevivitae TaxID=323412 RepID=A0A4Q7P1K5_9FLAO|nr:VWA domain-containing protein [Aquimarina brevivitae]RZS93721.1 hypothetical protein EV197_2301 [Aquimarina brevivitae]